MKIFSKFLCLWFMQFISSEIYAQPHQLNDISYPVNRCDTCLSLELLKLPAYRIFLLEKPARLVIDLKDTQLTKDIKQPQADHILFANIRAGTKNNKDIRIIVDLKSDLTAQSFSTSADFNNRELLIKVATPNSLAVKKEPVKTATNKNATASVKNVDGNYVIAIDAGHGGEDPGAQGAKGTDEKNITFAIAKKLADLINQQSGMKAVMTRKGDYYVGLRKRMNIARTAKADLFISIHADAFQDNSVSGVSVYTLSRNGASSEAAHWLAEKENSADLIGGVSLNDKEDDLASVLLDLSQNATIEASSEAANKILESFADVAELHKNVVQKAEFIVLKSPDIPSMLIETAFISNPMEEQNLLSDRYQNKIASAILKGIDDYFNNSRSRMKTK